MDRQNVLLKEYEVCQQHINTLGTQNWQSASIFLLVNALILAFVFSMKTHDRDSFMLVLITGVMVSLIFYLWRSWIKRQQFVQVMAYQRMREIEQELGLWKNWYVCIFDKLQSKELEESRLNSFSKENSSRIRQLRDYYKCEYAKAAGYTGLKWIAIIIMVSWLFLILREANLIFHFPVIGQWFLN